MTEKEFIEQTGESPKDMLGEDWELIVQDWGQDNLEEYALEEM